MNARQETKILEPSLIQDPHDVRKNLRAGGRGGQQPNGHIIYDGPSQFDGRRIKAIVTGIKNPSLNSKTGAVDQVYIINADIKPTSAINEAADYSICGPC